MRAISKIRIGLLATALAAGALASAPAIAQVAGSQLSLHGELNRLGAKKITGESRRMQLSHDEYRAVRKIEAALSVRNYQAAAAAIAAAEPVAFSNDAKFVVAALKLQLGAETHNVPLQDQAIEAALASGVASREQAIELYRLQGRSGLRVKDYARAEAALSKYVQLAPKDPEAYVLLAETKSQAGKPAEALSLLEQAIMIKTNARQRVPAKWMNAKAVLAAKASAGS